MSNVLFTWTYNGVEYTTNPFKIIPIVEGVDDENAGKPMWQALGMTEAEATTIKNNQQWWTIRQERDIKLKLTDWISGDDVPIAHKTKYQAYRQALRDITSQSDPYNITWPTEP
tara:strand:- start:9 stop:350 length:342 start_codon:yes stop_codon:yes gene_type:complete